MSVIPGKDIDAIQFFEQRAEGWVTAFETIGLTETQARDVDAATDDARLKYDAALAARAASKVATMAFSQAMRTMRSTGGNAVKTIRAFAESTANPEVYVTAQIPEPLPPQFDVPPTRAYDLRAQLDETPGAVKVLWKASQNEGGTAYIITRRIGSSGTFTFVGVASGRKSFVDYTIPAGSTRIDYIVTGQRGTLSGPDSPVLTVQFGIGGDGMMFVKSSEAGGPVKMAA